MLLCKDDHAVHNHPGYLVLAVQSERRSEKT